MPGPFALSWLCVQVWAEGADVTVDTEGRARDVDVVGRVHSTESFGTVDGPGTRFVVFCQGCPMRCQYCHNPDTWEFARADGTGPGTSVTVGELLERYERNRPFYRTGGITVTGGEPMAQPDFVAALFRAAHAAHAAPAGRIHTCLDTSAATFSAAHAERFSALLDATDMVLLDIKTSDPALHETLCGLPGRCADCPPRTPSSSATSLRAAAFPRWCATWWCPGSPTPRRSARPSAA